LKIYSSNQNEIAKKEQKVFEKYEKLKEKYVYRERNHLNEPRECDQGIQ